MSTGRIDAGERSDAGIENVRLESRGEGAFRAPAVVITPPLFSPSFFLFFIFYEAPCLVTVNK